MVYYMVHYMVQYMVHYMVHYIVQCIGCTPVALALSRARLTRVSSNQACWSGVY